MEEIVRCVNNMDLRTIHTRESSWIELLWRVRCERGALEMKRTECF